MNKKIVTSIFVLFLSLVMVSAVQIYSGESVELELEKPFEFYSVVGNSSQVDLHVSQEGNIVTIIPNKYMQNDSFEIIFFDVEERIINHYSGGGGGSKTIYRDRNITKYVDKIVEVQGDTKTIEIDKIIKEKSLVAWIVAIILLGIVLYLSFFRKTRLEGGKENE